MTRPLPQIHAEIKAHLAAERAAGRNVTGKAEYYDADYARSLAELVFADEQRAEWRRNKLNAPLGFQREACGLVHLGEDRRAAV